MVLDEFKLDGQVALVTGASRGLGQAMAVALAEAGADIGLVSNATPSTETISMVEAVGRRALPLVCDLATATGAELAGLVEATAERLGRLDILVNNAGIIRRTPALEVSADDWNEVIRVNETAPFFLAQAAARVMTAAGTGGRVINTASLLSYQGGINVSSYTASKHAIAGLTRALANEWAAAGVTVNAIVPGYFATDNTEQLRGDEDRSRSILERIPVGRWGVPEDVKGAVVFLASRASAYVTGSTLVVDGGWLAR